MSERDEPLPDGLPAAAYELVAAADRGDKLTAWSATARLLSWLADISHPIDAKAARRLVWRGASAKRWFDIAELLAEAVASRIDATPGQRRLHAQMLMERGFSEEALARLLGLQARPDLPDDERVELVGHVGRIHKDRFLDAVRRGDAAAARTSLQRALDTYFGWYRDHPADVWHGINAVALMARPEALALDAAAAASAQTNAQKVMATVLGADPGLADLYSAATVAEAHLALGNYAAALDAVRRHLASEKRNAFATGAFLRQLIQVWQLDRRPSPGPELIDLLRAGLMQQEGVALQMSGNDVRRAREAAAGVQYEAVFGGERFQSLENYRRGLDRCACVARIGRSAETGHGTGFLVQGGFLSPKLEGGLVLVTNAHVVSDAEEERKKGALHHTEAVVTFAALDGVSPEKQFGIGRLRFSSPPGELDVTVAELSEPAALKEPAPLAAVLPVRGSEASLRIIGHPSGRGLSFSVNRLLDHDGRKVHYRTATEGGSSGSPVFTDDWKLLAVHHVGGTAMPRLNGEAGTYEANEGIWIQSICTAVDKALSTG